MEALPQPVRFVTFLTFALNHHWHGYDVWGFHCVNIAIHLINVFLVWNFVSLLLRTPYFSKYISLSQRERFYSYSFFLPWAAALIFMCHPLQTQAITYITQRFASLATLFYLSAVVCFLKARFSLNRKRIVWGVLCLMSGVIGMFTKQIVMTLPIILLLLEYSFFLKPGEWRKVVAKINPFWFVFAAILFLIVPALYSFDVVGMLSMSTDSRSHVGDFINSKIYFLTQFRVLSTYIGLLWLPFAQNLDYDFVVTNRVWEFPFLLSLLFLSGIFFTACRLFNRFRLVAFGIFWFFIALLVESSVIPIKQVIFEHRCYLPSVGFSLLVAFLLGYAVRDSRKRWVCLGVCVLTLSWLTFQRNAVWLTEASLWKDAAIKSPRKERPYVHLGVAYLREGKYKAAVESLSQALKINPESAKAWSNRGIAYASIGRPSLAVANHTQAINIDPNLTEAYINRGVAYIQAKNVGAAIRDYNSALSRKPDNARIYYLRAQAFYDQQRVKDALDDFAQALILNPNYIDVYNSRGMLYFQTGKNQLAMNDFSKAIDVDPQFLQSYNNRGTVHRVLKRNEEALLDFNRALELNPKWPAVLISRGDTYRDIKKIDKAVLDYEKAMRLDPKNTKAGFKAAKARYQLKDFSKAVDYMDTLIAQNSGKAEYYFHRSIIQYSAGDFGKAQADMLQAQGLGSDNIQTPFAQKILKGLK